MIFSQEMKDLVRIFNAHGVQYLLVGGHAVNYYGYVRATQDIDFLIYPSAENAPRVMAALSEFGFGGAGIPQDAFTYPGTAVHLGVEPNRIDLLTHLKGISSDQLFTNRKQIEIEETPVEIISLEDLIAAKRLSRRLKDLADAEELSSLR